MKRVDRLRLAALVTQVSRIPSVGGGRNTATVVGLSLLNRLMQEMGPQITNCIMDIARDDDPASRPEEELAELKQIVDRHLADWS